MKRATAFSPASIGNVAVGFDVLGQALEGLGDRATVTLSETPGVRILAIRGVVEALPLQADKNTAGRALLSLAALHPGIGFELELEKGIPLGSGLGGSAASAVAALVAANALLDRPLSVDQLYPLAMDGEAVASGSRHGDNVAPMLLGGLVLAPTEGAPVRLDTPPGLCAAVVHPHFVLETRVAREVLKGPFALGEFVHQSEALALFLVGCARHDLGLIRRGLKDVLVEPRRASLIPGFAEVKRAALDAGALGASISGAGPSVFGWFESEVAARAAGQSMAQGFSKVGLGSDIVISPVDAPAARLER